MKKKIKELSLFHYLKAKTNCAFRNVKTNKTIFEKLCFEFAKLFVTITQDLYLFIYYYFYLYFAYQNFFISVYAWLGERFDMSCLSFDILLSFGCTCKQKGGILKLCIFWNRELIYLISCQWWITLLRHGRIRNSFETRTKTYTRCISRKIIEWRQTNEQTDRLTKKMITIYSETCVIEITVRSRQGFFAGIGVGVLMLLLLQ